MPKCTKKITITKSPMAHKTFSQEQLKWEYYKIVIPYKIILNEKVSSLESFLFFIQKNFYFPKNTLTIFSGESRYAWSHMIAARKADKINGNILWRQRRISLTFRKINQNGCDCKWPQYCDKRK